MSQLILPGNTVPSHVLAGDTFSAGTNYGTQGTMPNNGKKIITPSTAQQTIPQGYHDGTGYVPGDSNLIAANILSGVSIFGVSGNVIAGKRYASGTTNSSGSTSTFGYASGSGTTTYYTVTVSGLAFKPSTIIAIEKSNHYVTVVTSLSDSYHTPTAKCFGYSGTSSSVAVYNFVMDNYAGSLTVGGFVIPAQISNFSYDWIAIE